MPISFTCPHCGANKNVPDHYAGQTGPCAECGETVTIPGTPMAAPPPKSSTAPIVIILGVAVAGLLACGGVTAALLLPAISAARGAASSAACNNNLRQIALALHNYHNTHGSLPAPYIADEDGKPMHSWRVAILPFLEQQHIFNQYNFDEPWDGPSNSQLAATYPTLPVYRCPDDVLSGPSGPSYMAVVVPDGLFEAGKWNSLSDVTDGASNTIMVVEVVGATSHWMEPVDLDQNALNQMINAARDGTGLASNHSQGVNVVFADGSTRRLTSAVDLETLRLLITKSDGKPVMLP